MNGMIYIINSDNMIVRKMECDYNSAISNYYGKITEEGRWHILPKNMPPPYKEVQPVKFDKRKYPEKL